MDPVSQGVVGVVASQQASRPKYLLSATLLGIFAGMTPDLDVLIQSDIDPLLNLEYHRQFTHSLTFIPVGSFVCALLAYVGFFRWRPVLSFKEVWLFCALGYASHGLLDACTSYGTLLFWPFSDARIAWNTISIIDPIFTLPLLVLVLTATIRKNILFARMASVWVLVYLAFGVIQRERAEQAGWELVESRGHTPLELNAKPSFANSVVWKIVYTTETHYYVDAVRVGWGTRIFEGDRIEHLDLQRDFPWLQVGAQQAKDVERFRWFSNGYIALSPQHPNRIIDIRYSVIPNELGGMWGIELDKNATHDAHANYVDGERDSTALKRLWEMVTSPTIK